MEADTSPSRLVTAKEAPSFMRKNGHIKYPALKLQNTGYVHTSSFTEQVLQQLFSANRVPEGMDDLQHEVYLPGPALALASAPPYNPVGTIHVHQAKSTGMCI